MTYTMDLETATTENLKNIFDKDENAVVTIEFTGREDEADEE